MSEETVVVSTPPVETQAPADPTTKIEAPAETTEATVKADEAAQATETQPETTDETQPDEPKKKPSGIDRLKRRAALLQADADALARENEELRRRSVASDPREGTPGVDRAPTEADFPNDYLAYERAQNAWNTTQAIERALQRREAQSREGQLREARQERLEVYEENVAEVRERIPDFDKVIAEAKGIAVSPALADEIMQSEKSALIQYHLAKNPDKVRDLNGLSGRELAREIGRLESRVHLPTPKKATDAPPPPSQVKGAAAQAIDPVAGPDDMNAYAAWRKKQASA